MSEKNPKNLEIKNAPDKSLWSLMTAAAVATHATASQTSWVWKEPQKAPQSPQKPPKAPKSHMPASGSDLPSQFCQCIQEMILVYFRSTVKSSGKDIFLKIILRIYFRLNFKKNQLYQKIFKGFQKRGRTGWEWEAEGQGGWEVQTGKDLGFPGCSELFPVPCSHPESSPGPSDIPSFQRKRWKSCQSPVAVP